MSHPWKESRSIYLDPWSLQQENKGTTIKQNLKNSHTKEAFANDANHIIQWKENSVHINIDNYSDSRSKY